MSNNERDPVEYVLIFALCALILTVCLKELIKVWKNDSCPVAHVEVTK